MGSELLAEIRARAESASMRVTQGTELVLLQALAADVLVLVEVAEAARESVAADNEEFGSIRSEQAFRRLEAALADLGAAKSASPSPGGGVQ